MAKSRVSVSIGRTINTGNFESFRADVRVERDPKEGEKRSEVFVQLNREAEGYLDLLCAPVLKALERKDERRKS